MEISLWQAVIETLYVSNETSQTLKNDWLVKIEEIEEIEEIEDIKEIEDIEEIEALKMMI